MPIVRKILFVFIAGVLLFLWICPLLVAQETSFNIDSFRNSVQKLSSDTEKIAFIIDKAMTLSCDDSIVKLKLANEAKKLALKQKWPSGVYQSNRVLSDININCYKNYQKVFEIFEETAELAKINEDVYNEALALEGIAKNYSRTKQNDKVIEYFGKALLLKPGSELEEAILADLGHSYGSIADYPNAITYYDSSLKLIESESIKNKKSNMQDSTMRIGLKLNMGDIYLAMPDNTKALKTFEDVLEMSQTINKIRFIELSLTGIGRSYKQQKKFAKALEYFQRALLVCRERVRFDDEVVIQDEMANTYLDSGDYYKAREYADSALSLADGQHYMKLLSKANATFGNANLKLNHPDLAVFYLQKALDYSVQTQSLNDQKDAWFGLFNAYKVSGHCDKALDAYQNFISTRDSTSNIDKTKEAIRKDLEIKNIRELTKAEDNYHKKLEQGKLFLYGEFGGLVMLLALAFFMYRNYNTQKKYNALLSKEKKANLAHIAAQSHVLSDIVHIQAHEIRGPVSAILGFVQIFNFEDATDPNNKEIMYWIGESANKLDFVVRNVVSKENELRAEHPDEPVN